MSDFERRIEMTPSFDKRDPEPSKNYGIGAIRIFFYLIGPRGAVHWMIGTNWYVPSAQEHLRNVEPRLVFTLANILGGNEYQPQAWDLGFHSKTPLAYQEADKPSQPHCDVIGGPCWYDGSALNAERLIQPFLAGGSEGVWKELEAYYHDVFDEEEIEA